MESQVQHPNGLPWCCFDV